MPCLELRSNVIACRVCCSLVRGRSSDGFRETQELFMRAMLRDFPYSENTLIQTIVKTLAPIPIVCHHVIIQHTYFKSGSGTSTVDDVTLCCRAAGRQRWTCSTRRSTASTCRASRRRAVRATASAPARSAPAARRSVPVRLSGRALRLVVCAIFRSSTQPGGWFMQCS